MSSSLHMTDFYPTAEPAEAEATPNGVTQKSVATQKSEHNRTPTDISKKDTKPPTPAEIQRQQRIDQLIQLLFIDGYSFTDACNKLGIGRTTGYEYYKTWKAEQEPLKVDSEFWELLTQVKEDNPEKALDAITKIKLKQTESNVNMKAQVTAEVTENIEANVTINTEQLLAEYDAIIKEATTQTPNLPKNNTTEQIHQTTPPS